MFFFFAIFCKLGLFWLLTCCLLYFWGPWDHRSLRFPVRFEHNVPSFKIAKPVAVFLWTGRNPAAWCRSASYRALDWVIFIWVSSRKRTAQMSLQTHSSYKISGRYMRKIQSHIVGSHVEDHCSDKQNDQTFFFLFNTLVCHQSVVSVKQQTGALSIHATTRKPCCVSPLHFFWKAWKVLGFP